MNHRPVIGLTGYRNLANESIALRETYIGAVIRAGGLPVILPMESDGGVIDGFIDHIDGLLLSGGGDVDPARYGEQRVPACGEPDYRRDEFELRMIMKAIEKKMPVFGICRGIQVLNVAYGGTLFQDIESQCGIPCAQHRQQEPYTALQHEVRLSPGGLLERITGMTHFMTNSMHHQSIKKLGGTLVIEGVADDGIIEAVRDSRDESVFGVQFHPEFFASEHEYAQKLFDYFVSKAIAYHANQKTV